MARDPRAAANKRAREKAQQERHKEKEQRRLEARERKNAAIASGTGEDPDIAGIQPGPQPRPEWMEGLDEEKDDDAAAESDSTP
jgi:hypothetical protein